MIQYCSNKVLGLDYTAGLCREGYSCVFLTFNSDRLETDRRENKKEQEFVVQFVLVDHRDCRSTRWFVN